MIPQPMQAPQQAAPPQHPQRPPVTIDAVVALLRDDCMRSYKIDVETDSLVEADQQAEKQHATELLTSVAEFAAKVGPIMAQMPPLVPMFGALLQHAVSRFKPPASLEEAIEQAMEKAGMLLQNPPPPKPSPDEMVKLEGTKVKTQAEIQKAQIGAQQAQSEGQMKMASMAMDHQTKQAEHGMKMQEMALDRQQSQEEFFRQQAAGAMGGREMDRQEELAAIQHERAMQLARMKGQR